MASFIYNFGRGEIGGNGNIDWVNDTIKVALLSSAYTPDKDAHDDFADLTNEISGTGYVADGKTILNPVVTIDDANDRSELSCDDVVWTVATFTARYGAVYKYTGTPGTSTLIALIDFGEDLSPVAEDFTIGINAQGLIQI